MKKLIEALHTIKDECKEHINCSQCPMGTTDCDCLIRDVNPNHWKINDEVLKALL